MRHRDRALLMTASTGISIGINEVYGSLNDGSGSLVADDFVSDPDESAQADSVQIATNGNSAFFPINFTASVRIQCFEYYGNCRGYTALVGSDLIIKTMLNDVNYGGVNLTGQKNSDNYSVNVSAGDFIQFFHQGGSYRRIQRLIITG